MNTELLEVLRQIERSRKVERSVLIEAIEAALISASRKNYGVTQDIQVRFNEETGDLIAYVKKTVVSEVKEPWHEITLEEASHFKPQSKVGDLLEISMAPAEFGRIAAQTAKQVVLQRVRESERNAIYEEYKRRVGEVINGVVLRIENRNLIVDLGETEALLPAREQVPREFYQVGERIRAYILDVRRSNRAPQVILSRSHPGLIRKLFEMEVPEVTDGAVIIKSVAREAGARSKVAVQSKDINVDPVGACVGIKGSRIQTIVREIHGEKIDVIPYSENIETMLKSALQPAKIMQIKLSAEEQYAVVIVKDDQLSLAIGKNGQNVRLASKLIGWKIDIVSDTQNQEEMRRKAEEAFLLAAPPLEKIPGVSARLAEKLRNAGYTNVADFRNVTIQQLQNIPGIGQKTAQKILDSLKSYLPKTTEVKPERTAAELFAGLGGEGESQAHREKEIAAGDLFADLDQNAASATAPDQTPDQTSDHQPPRSEALENNLLPSPEPLPKNQALDMPEEGEEK